MYKQNIDDETNQEEIDGFVYEDTDDMGEEQNTKEKIKKLRTELSEIKKDRDEYLTGWQKAKADYINLKNEHDKVGKLLRLRTQVAVVADLLPVLDSFQMAMGGEAWESVESNWRMGVEYIYQQLWKTLEDYGVTEIAEIDVSFDPQLHEPMEIEQVTQESQNDQVLAIIQKGYRIGDTIIRPAKVKVGKLEN